MSGVDDLFDFHSDHGWNQDQRDGRYYGFLDGTVVEVESDNPRLCRIKADIGIRTLDGNSATVMQTTDWCDPLLPGAIEAVPNKGDAVYVSFVQGDPNRPVYLCHPTTRSEGRPTEAAMLGTMFVGMFNYFVTQFNQLRADFNTLAGQTAGHTHTGVTVGMGTTGAAAITKSSTTAADAQKGKAADGSVVADKSTSEIVLSGKITLR
jgi:hypothetical protein